MKFNKEFIIIIVLASMLMSAIGSAYYFYDKQNKILQDSNKKMKVYIAKNDIEKNAQIKESDLTTHIMTKQEILKEPLTQKEIVGKFATTKIYKNELFIKEKISVKPIELEEKEFLDFKSNSYNLAFKLFQNPNYTLQKGDIINIVSAYQTTESKLPDFKSQYIAKNIKVLGFISAGRAVAYAINKTVVQKKDKKNNVTETIEDVKADEIVLDINDQTLLNFTQDFQKTHNLLWMVKTTEQKIEEPKKEILSPVKETKFANTPKAPRKITYDYVRYVPKAKVTPTLAVIEYADNDQMKNIASANMVKDYTKECLNDTNLLLGISDKINLKSSPNNSANNIFVARKNYIFSYIEKVSSWYLLCDESYVNEKDVEKTTKEFANSKLKKK